MSLEKLLYLPHHHLPPKRRFYSNTVNLGSDHAIAPLFQIIVFNQCINEFGIVHFHPVYFPVKQGMAYTCPLLWTNVKGWFFIETKIFQAREWLWVCVWGSAQNHSLAWKILVEIKNHPEIEVIKEGRYTHNLLPGTIYWVEEYFTSWKDRLNKYLEKRPRDRKTP